jgi:DNA-binding CsgD family transcriptional regulator
MAELSAEERRALTLLSRPRTKNEVCEEMRISREALRGILVSITDKLGVGSLLEAIAKFTGRPVDEG